MTKTFTEGAKRYPLNMRTTEATRARLEKEAQASGRSLAQEVEYCVEQYYGIKNEFEMYRKPIIQMMALALKQTELSTGHNWYDDSVSAQRFRRAAISIIDLMYPKRLLADMLAEEYDDTSDAISAEKLALEAYETSEGKDLESIVEALSQSKVFMRAFSRVKNIEPTG